MLLVRYLICISIYKIVSRDTRVCIIHTQRWQVPQTFPSTKLSLGIQECVLYTHKDGRYLKLSHLQNCLQGYKCILYTHKDDRYLKLTNPQNCLQRYKSVYYTQTKTVGISNLSIYKIVFRDTKVCIIHKQRWQVPQTCPSTKLSLGIQECVLYTNKDGRYLKLTHLQNCLQRYKSVYSVQSRVRHSRDFCLSGAIEMVNWTKSGALLFYLLRSSQ